MSPNTFLSELIIIPRLSILNFWVTLLPPKLGNIFELVEFEFMLGINLNVIVDVVLPFNAVGCFLFVSIMAPCCNC